MDNYYVKFIYKGIEDERIKAVMANELVRVYNVYCDRANAVIPEWNSEWNHLNPNKKLVIDENMAEYDRFMVKKHQAIADELNNETASTIMEFYVGNEIELHGRLKLIKSADVTFCLVKG